eukprot:comp12400_c0_seq1/m.16224 comp12400_c0_seq1/g.16224  ORF comp12400_c0_seq1/g.16224 comp12400_c0_seq1/m.16224 type:complete len:272 (-) comp12400_c0_seq1:35-850(-)
MRETLAKARKEQDDAFKADLQRKMERSKQEEEKAYQARIAAFHEEEEHAEAVFSELQSYHQNRQHKAERLYDEWNHNVYKAIRGEIRENMAKVDTRQARKDKERLFNNYLSATSSTAGVFRDIVSVADYDPYATQKYTARYTPGKVRDPVKRDMMRKHNEDKIIADAEGRKLPPAAPLGRQDMIDVRKWLVIDSTPYPDRVIVPRESEHPLKQSKVVFDHYVPPSHEEIAKEVPRQGKKIIEREPQKDSKNRTVRLFPEKWRSNPFGDGFT